MGSPASELTISIEPGTYVILAGMMSVKTVLVAVSVPVLVNEMVYSISSPLTTSPPFKSLAVLLSV